MSDTCTLTMDAAKSVTANFTGSLTNQTITFGSVPTVVVGGTGVLSATGGASGQPVIFSSLTEGICTVSGSTVTGVAAGTCTVAANQAGNGSYSAAPQVTQNITVTPPLPSGIDDNFVVVQFSSPSVLGAGAGDDTYLLSGPMLPAGKTLTLTDTAGSNSIQLARGLSIAASKVTTNALQLTLSSGAVINVLGADKFTYEPGGNSTDGINQADISYASFVADILGVTMPAGSAIATGGAVVIGGSVP